MKSLACFDRDPQSLRWPIRGPVKVRTHQDRVNNYVDINTDGFLPGLGHQPIDGQDTCAICLNPFGSVRAHSFENVVKVWFAEWTVFNHETIVELVGSSSWTRTPLKQSSHTQMWSLLLQQLSQKVLSHLTLFSHFSRWLGTTRQCPLCRRTVSEVSSEGRGSDFGGFQVPSSGPSSTAARLTLGETPAMLRSRFSHPEVNSFISPLTERRPSRYASRRRTRERSIDSYNSWTSGDMSD